MLINRYYSSQQQGKEIKDISHQVATDMVEDAEDLFVAAKERLLDINNWHKYGNFDLSFSLTDNQGKPIGRHAHKGDYIRISKYMTVNAWAYIEAIEYDDYPDIDVETFTMHLVPTDAPHHSDSEAPAASQNEEAVLIERRGVKLLCTCYNILPVIPDEIWAKLMNGLIEFL